MVRLTEEMVASRTRLSDCTAVKKLNCWGTELSDVSILRRMKNVEVLSLSVNNISTLADFQYCFDLKDLFIRKNNIIDLNEVCYLQALPNLRNLWLEENPCAEVEGYRLAVLKALPHLEKLDDKIVTPEEVQSALVKGRSLVHPLNSGKTEFLPPLTDNNIPNIVINNCGDNESVDKRKQLCSSEEQQITDEVPLLDNRQETDRKNANYNTPSMEQCILNSKTIYEDKNQKYGYTRHLREPNVIKTRISTTASCNLYTRAKCTDEILVEEDESRIRSVTQAKPINYNTNQSSNILSAVLCLVKELDFQSLEVVEMAVRSRLNNFEE